ncbi:MAG: hypothetical protein AAF911_13570 [Planctomycetota bacterium]
MSISAHIVMVPDDAFNDFFQERHLEFKTVPRIGEYLVHEDTDNNAQAFEVLAVIHPTGSNPITADTELRVKHIGTEVELFTAINASTN